MFHGLTPIKQSKTMENLHDKQSEGKEGLSVKEAKRHLAEIAFFARQNHDQARRSLIESLCLQRREELIKGFLIEMDAKNQAYHFILEQGYFEEFSSYCRSEA